MRNSFYNNQMALFEGKEKWVYGSVPLWYGSHCKEINPENLKKNSAYAGVVYNSGDNQTLFEGNLCKAGEFDINPITIEFDTDKDVIYEGEDYFAMPIVKSTEGEILPLKIIEQESYDWLETGSPADYWKNNYDEDVAGVGGFAKKFYVRSINDAVRQHQNMPVGTYTYKLQAKDDKGNEAVVTRTVEILDGKRHSSSNSNGLAVLTGDETWFKNYQLDIATGIERYADEGIFELKKGYHYDYYGQLQGNVADQKSKFNEWYSNPGFEQHLDDCGNGRYRIRYVYENSIWNLFYNTSYYDIKTGVVNSDESPLVKINDYSMQPFVDVEKGVLKLYGRKYNPNVPLYDEKGNLLWGNPPKWHNSCKEVGKIEKKITIDFDTDSDVIYEGEDYFAMPIVKSTEGDIVSLTVVEQSDYDWLETGTPTDYWKNNYGEDVAGVDGFVKTFYVRSLNGFVRQHDNMPAKFYTYTLKAEDDKGNVTTLTRKVRILEGEKHPAANTNGLAILVGDETWFKNYQLDIATGIERYANENTIDLKKGYHYDYYGQLEGSVLNKKSMFNDWYSNPGFKQILDDCGEGRYRIRYEFVADNPWIIYFNQSYFDIKTGIVNNSQSKLVKINDYSMQPFVDAENGVLKLYGRKYNPNVPLYDEKGKLLWGNPPEWNNNCKEVGAIKDLPHDNPGGGDVIIPSDKKLTAQFYDAARTIKEQGQFNFRILNKGANDVDVGGYEMRFYYSEYENPNPVASDIAYYYSSNLPSDQLAASFSYEKCAENMYVLKIKPKDGSVAKAQGSYPEYDHIRLNAQLKNVWSDIHRSSMHSWNNANEIMDNPKMSLFDKNGFWVYGEKDLCNPATKNISEEYKYNNLTIQFQDPDMNEITKIGDFKFQINNSGSEDYFIGNYEMRFYFQSKNNLNFDASEIRFFNGYIANSQVTKEWCGDGNYFLKIKLGSDAFVKANNHFPEKDPINVITRRILKANAKKTNEQINSSNEDYFILFDKNNLDSWRNYVEMADNSKMGLFDADGNWIWGYPGYKCENPITITSGHNPDESRFLVEENEKLLPYMFYDDKNRDVVVENGINEVSLKVKNISDLDEEGPVFVDYFFTHPDGQVPVFCYSKGETCFVNTLSSSSSAASTNVSSNKNIEFSNQDVVVDLTNDLSVVRMSVGNKHVYRFILKNGLGKKGSRSDTKIINFSIRDNCVDCIEEKIAVIGVEVPLAELYCDLLKKENLDIPEECGEDWNPSKFFVWKLEDDWSAQFGVTDEYMITERVVIYSKDENVLYGKRDPEAPKFKRGSGNGKVPIPEIVVQDQYPNRTDAVVYSGGQLLLNGTFEEPSLVGWSIEHGNASSIRGKTVQGSRYLNLNGRISQTLSNTTLSILLDSGAVLSFWHKSDECPIESSSSTKTILWLTMPSSVIGYASPLTDTYTFECSHDWKKESIFIDKERFMTSLGKVNENFTIKLSSVVNVYFDDIALVPGKKEQSSIFTVRLTTTQHEELETRVYDNDRKDVVVTSSERDAMGRSRYKYLPFKMMCSDAESCNADPITQYYSDMAKKIYDGRPGYADAQGFPYSETLWKPDPMATKDVVGGPGKVYSIGEKHLVRGYTSGINLSGIDPLDFVELNSAVKAVYNDRTYSDYYGNKVNYHAAKDMNPTHFWELFLDQNDNATFTIKDGDGHVIVSGALKKIPNAGSGEVAYELLSRSVNELDVRGNVIKAHPPLSCDYTENKSKTNCVWASEYEYDSQSRVIRSWEPDLEGNSKDKEHHGMGSTITYYDMAGRVRATQTQNQINKKTASVVIYDDLDRIVATGEWMHGYDESSLNKLRDDLLSDETLDENKDKFPTKDKLTSGTVTRTYYDKEPSATEVAGLGVELHPDGVKLNYTRGRVAAIISDVGFDDVGNVIRVSTANSYDKYGRVVASYTYDPTLPADLRMMAVETEYDLGGKVLASTKYPYGLTTLGRIRSITETYTYDRLGRVSDIYTKNGNGSQAILAHYEYYPTGSVKNITMGNALMLSYTYHISGAVKTATVKSIEGKELYSETLHYEDSDNPQYNGNISRMVHQMAHGNSNYGELRDVQYVYDELNRLTRVDDSKQDVFDEMFTYDNQGRITAQHRAKEVNGKYSLAQDPTGGEYSYYEKTNRLKSVADGMGGTSASGRIMSDPSDPNNFVYDSEGNLTEDKSKGLKISYDWRGMPIEFIQESQPTGSSGNSLFRLTMAYDGSGRRISKTRWVKKLGSQEWEKELVTHYTGIGTEIREDLSKNQTKVVVNMPEGFGRYGVEDASKMESAGSAGEIPMMNFEWYLKNHLGSTMLVYGTQGDVTHYKADFSKPKAAYDYRAFGEMLELTPPATGKVTENFTGKEHDDEIALNYFGARYLDPMLGMWISVDPKRQFSSPYLYAGNGMNPVNVVDPNGNYAIWEHNADDPANHHYVYRYSSYADFAIEGFASFFIPGSGLLACMPPKGLVEHSLRPSPAEGVFSAVFSAAGFAVNNLIKVASGVKLAFKTVGTVKNIYDAGQFALKGPRLENFMHDLTSGSNLLSSTNLEDLKRKAEWATSYGKNLLDKGVEINDDVRAQFLSDFQSEFANDTKD